ncbi:MAG: YheV family putative metal-binding protein [Trueperaceae bacterium]
MRFEVDAEGFREGVECPRCSSTDTVTFRYLEGFDELECSACGYRSDDQELDSLTRYASGLLEEDTETEIPIPRRSIQA